MLDDNKERKAQYLLGLGVADGSDEMANLIAHRLGRDTGRRSAEIDMAGASDSRVERVGARHQVGVGHAAMGE
jgi:hypothetical protein